VRNAVPLGLLALTLVACGATRAARDGQDDRIAALEQENAALRADLAKLQGRLDGIAMVVCPGSPPIDAHVLEVEPTSGLVWVDKGAEDGVRLGYTFAVYREATFKGLVRVIELMPTRSRCAIASERTSVSPGDSAATSL